MVFKSGPTPNWTPKAHNMHFLKLVSNSAGGVLCYTAQRRWCCIIRRTVLCYTVRRAGGVLSSEENWCCVKQRGELFLYSVIQEEEVSA